MINQKVVLLSMILALGLIAEKGPAQEKFSEDVLELQGVWNLSSESPEKLNMAKLVVHGSYFLLIFEWPGKDAREFQLMEFTADGSQILDSEGNRCINYVIHGKEKKEVNFEIRDESIEPTSKYTEITLTRIGTLPDLNLKN